MPDETTIDISIKFLSDIYIEKIRKISTFELIDGDILKEKVWDFDLEEDIDYYLKAAGIESKFFMFTFGLPMYILGYSFGLAILLPIINCIRN